MLLIIASIFFTAHLVAAGIALVDLFTKSKRRDKVSWMFFILLVPILGLIVYNGTKQRKTR